VRSAAAIGENGPVDPPPADVPAPGAAPLGQRQRILDTALSLMGQRGVDGTSMRDLAQATGLNVASLYHYFPSKRDLLVAVLAERGFLDDLASTGPPSGLTGASFGLDDLLSELLSSMLEVEDFIRLMLGEVMRGDETAFELGQELFTTTQQALERWLTDSEPELCSEVGADAVARLLRAMLVGLFFEHVAGVLGDEDPEIAFTSRAAEVARVLRARAD